MALRLEDKKALVKEVNAVAGDSVTAVAAEYRGLSVAQMTELRREARNAGVYMRVVKNTLARRAVEGTEFECMKESLKGPILLAFAKDDPGAAARVIKDFAKGHEALQAVSLSAGGQFHGTDEPAGTHVGRACRHACAHDECTWRTGCRLIRIEAFS
jgi:large subunit ribosomal protein L10